VGVGRLSAATAPVSVLVDPPGPVHRSPPRPAVGVLAVRLDPGPHVRSLEQHMAVSWAGSRSVESTKVTCGAAASISA
jgi:hypothetical protein